MKKIYLLLSLVFFLMGHSAWSQANDACTGALPIACGQTINSTTVGATVDAVATCGTTLNTAPGIWYTFVGNGSSNTLTMCGSAYDTKIGVFSGTCAALTCVTGNDDFCGFSSQVTFNTVSGTTYFVLVTGFSTASGTFTLTRTCVAPANDLCTGAIPITCTQTITGSTIGANSDAVATCGTTLNSAPGVWYTFPGDGFSTTLSLCGSSFDTKIGLFSGTCGALVCVTGNDDFCGFQSEVSFTSVVGTNYFVLVTGFATNAGAFTLARSCVLPPCLPSTITPATATICQGLIQQLTSSSANPGNPGHIWAPVTELFTDALATVPYTGTATNTVYARPSITRTYTATLSSTSCTPTPASVTVTVNPNPEVVIVADPGTTICEGDPTLLTVRLGTSTPVGTLYTQGTTPADGSPSQVFEPANAAFTSQAADDFTVPAGTTWTVTRVTANGFGTGNPTSVNVFFYANSGANLPGAAVVSYNNVVTFVRTGPNYSVTLPSAAVLAPGTYWVSIQVNMSFASGGQWFWGNFGTTNIGNQYAWQNPGGGFGTPCASWGYGATGCNVGGGSNRNNVFSIIGSSLTGGGPLPGGYSFLWTPAAGLSSTTSNPVAASPMNTTTYTVTVTTPGGCVRTAQTLITVNKRPTVTTQPINAAICSGLTATFTVVGTGTALTYQWQESPTGCAGPWTNLTNGGIYNGVNTATLSINPVTGTMTGYAYRVILSGSCAPVNNANISNCAVLTVNPLPVVTITPVISCGGVATINGTQLSVGSAPPPVPGTVSVNSGTINLAVPDNIANGVNNIIAMAGVPANATITNVSVTLNMSHTYPGDMIYNLQAPNGQILNLYKYGTGVFTGPASGVPTWGWYGAKVSQTGNTAWSTVATAPFIYNNSTAWRADAINTPVVGAIIQNPTGFISAATSFANLYTTPASTTGNWTLAMADGGPGDVGTLSSWNLTIDYTTPGGGGGPTLTYVWSPLAGLYNDPQATSPYIGANTPVVYAAPTVFTAYTVTATNTTTGCIGTSTAFVNYTPPAPAVTPTSVTMCLGDPAVRLTSSSSTTTTSTVSAASGTISVPIADATGAAATSTLNITGVPTGAVVSEVKVTMNINHTWVGDVHVNLRAPNNQILNLVGALNGGTGGNATDDFTNTALSSIGTAPISGAPAPRTGTFAAEARTGYGPTGFIQTTNSWAALTPTSTAANGAWTLAMGDFVGGDVGTLTSWSIGITTSLTVGVPSTPATWSPIAGLFNDAAATIAYAGTARDTVWTRPGVTTTYSVTVQSLPAAPIAFSNPAPVIINPAGIGNPYPSNVLVSGLPPTGVSVKSVTISGITHSWSEDVDILLQSPSGQNVILMSDIGGATPYNGTYILDDAAPTSMNGAAPPPSGTYKPTNMIGAIGPEPDNWPGVGTVAQPLPTLATFTGNMNGTWKLFVFDDAAGDQGSISGGFSVNFNLGIQPCTSPAKTVLVTVNTPTTVATQPVDQTICTDKIATFTVAGGGTGPFSYQWQESRNGGNAPWTNIINGGVYSGATTATLTITRPPVSMSGYHYRAIITGAAPCSSATSLNRILIVNPLPNFTITNTPSYRSLFPGLTTTLSAVIITTSAPRDYSWLRNGVPVATTPTYLVNIDRLGTYTLSITDLNGCTDFSKNSITIKDSVSGKCFIYPNPTSGQFEVRFHSSFNDIVPRSLIVFDAKGDRVYTKLYPIGRPYDRMPVDMRAYGKGLYWVEVVDVNGNRLTMCRVVIQ